ncbi:pantoate--beta-alanine ligase [Rhizobium sp. SEMIA 4085]|uniref:Pantothenate synthetase n=1 Tax=Rhizobium gallicum bv. gallicum R602sp TaxID=1041138 RepID=A0A0B4XC08_9HYPH|nr:MULTISPECIES: pantoate--beta-alanine ligase [Rhizobium]AJD45524.1 pantothenate synthetase [Rhizobium gallicum bv. gallicum R602sp]NNH30438.1 pantoate--beta-alanine ligase [Rhizobium sp. SEMIA 4085]
MRVVTRVAELREHIAAIKNEGRTLGFVPTMGYLHAGHMELVGRACSGNDAVVVSIFVNPLQFGRNEDLTRYPRDLERDSAMLSDAGVDILFSPSVQEMYPQPMQTIVDVPALGSELEGAVRPGHFAGVATVVTKLFNIVQPHAAYFGKKDYQQVVIIKRMVEDLALPVRIVAVETVREADGLAFSSRNSYLTADERAAAVIVPKALDEAERLYRDGIEEPQALEAALAAFIAREPLAEAEVVAVRDPQTLTRLETLRDRQALVALFVRIGSTRLLDNRIIGHRSQIQSRAA